MNSTTHPGEDIATAREIPPEIPTGTVAATLPTPDPAPSAASVSAGDANDPSGDAAPEFGPLDDPPRVEGVELIGEDADEATTEFPVGLESSPAASIPPEQPPGFTLPVEMMQRAGEIGQETAAISEHVQDIERVNEEAEAALKPESGDPGADGKES